MPGHSLYTKIFFINPHSGTTRISLFYFPSTSLVENIAYEGWGLKMFIVLKDATFRSGDVAGKKQESPQ